MRRALLAAAAIVVVALVVAQLVLPGIAESKLRSDLARSGRDVSVEVSAFPAIKLLWKKADRVTVRVSDLQPGTGGSGDSLADLLARTNATKKLDVRVAVLDEQLLRMQEVRLRKRGATLDAEVTLRRADVDAALPAHLSVTGAADGDGLSVAGETSVFGANLRAQAKVLVDDGRIVLRPEGIPLASLATVTIFSDDRIAVDAIGTRPTADGFAVTARGHLRD